MDEMLFVVRAWVYWLAVPETPLPAPHSAVCLLLASLARVD